MEQHITWSVLFLLPSAILGALLCLIWVIRKLWRERDDQDIAL